MVEPVLKMTRRKSVCLKWTLVLIVLVCPFVYSRPQETAPITTSINSVTEKSTDAPIRYRLESNLDLSEVPEVIGFVNSSYYTSNNNSSNIYKRNSEVAASNVSSSRRYRSYRISSNYRNNLKSKVQNPPSLDHMNIHKNQQFNVRKTPIRRVITKWTDRTRYEDLDSYETSNSGENERDPIRFTNSNHDRSSTENLFDDSTEITEKYNFPQSNKKVGHNGKNKHYYHLEQDDPNFVHSNKVHIIDQYPFPTVRPTFIFTTPTPTPIITNVGAPTPWSEQYYSSVYKRPTTTQKPVRVTKPLNHQYNSHNSNHYYPQHSNDNFEVTTFQPSNAYTERIVIRPEEYSASSDDCPTIYLTLNNTFQGQGKEACPDLNIAVNTNVINKNVVVESEEEDGVESLFPGTFGLPLGEDSGETDSANDYNSDESQDQIESASVEATEFSNYNAANGGIDAEAPGTGGVSPGGSPSGALHKPGKPHKPSGGNKDDDFFGISGLAQYFRPALNAFSWLAAISPFGFSVFSLFTVPLALLFAAYSGITTLLSPLGLSARQAPKIVHVYRPHWDWDDEHKTWLLHTLHDNRRWRPRLPRNSQENNNDNKVSVKPTWFFKVKEWMKNLTEKLKERNRLQKSNQEVRKNRRIKRETWMKRVK